MEKKLISLLLAVLMMFSALPITVFAAESEYPESEHPYGYGEYEWTYEGKPGTKSLSVTFSDKTEFNEGDELEFCDQNGNLIGSAGSELAGKTVDFNASSLRIRLYGWNSDSSYYGFKITNIRENNYEVDGTVIPGEDCKITEDRATGTITFEPATTESDDGYISLSYSVLGSRTVKWVKRIVVKPGFNDTINFNAFVNAEVLDFAEDFDFSYSQIEETSFYKNKSNWNNESLYLGNKLVKLGENDTIKAGTTIINQDAIQSSFDVIIPDSVICIGEYNYPYSIFCTKGSYAQLWAENIDIDYTCIGDLKVKFKNCIITKGTPLSSVIEVYKLSSDYTWKQITEYSSSGYSSSKVGAQTVTISDGDASIDFIIALSNDKNEYINFKDQSLYEELISCTVDKDEDGIISVAEMRAYDGDISLYGVQDISGLEYADSATRIYGYNDRISAEKYFALQKYNDIYSNESKIPLSFFKNNREKWGRLEVYQYNSIDFTKKFSYQSSNESVVYVDNYFLNLVSPGDAVITVTFGSVSKKFNVHVNKNEQNNDLGTSSSKIPVLVSASIINTSDGEVYLKTENTFKKINNNCTVLMANSYKNYEDGDITVYYITSDNVLWKNDKKLGENFKKISDTDKFNYASCNGIGLDYDGNCYHLKDMKLIDTDVADISGKYYLKSNGELYNFSHKTEDETPQKIFVDSDVKNIISSTNDYKIYYSKKDNTTYLSTEKYYETGNENRKLLDHTVKDISSIYEAKYYYTDESNNLWIVERDNTEKKVGSNVKRIGSSNWRSGLYVYLTSDGDFYYSREAKTPYLSNVKKIGEAFYLDTNDDLYVSDSHIEQDKLTKIMTHVVDFYEIKIASAHDYRAVFTRTDGSVWSYRPYKDEYPVKILDGNGDEHTHTFNHITVPSTCKVAGMEYDICSECGETFNEKTLPLAAHTWSEWTVVKEATTTAEGQEKRTCSVCDKVETRAIEKLKVIKDDKTGIEINYNNEYDSDTEIKVEEQFSGKSFQLINAEFGKVNSKIYDIATYKDGVKVQPNGEITVKVPLPDGFTTNKVFVCYVDSVSGKVTKIPCEVKDGYVIFKTNHFSEYAIVEQPAKVKSVSVSDIKLNYKKSATIKPTIKADEGAKYTVKYSSSNTKVATVDENGKVYAAKKGSATITCTVTDSNGNTVQDTCKVTVKYSFGQWLIKILLFGWIWY